MKNMPQVYNLPQLKHLRGKLRNNMTKSEIILWKHLNHDQLGYRFRRQYGVDNYIVDFYCPKLKLVIEIDGSTHYEEDVFQNDKIREACLQNLGLKVKRYNNSEIFNNLENVLKDIYQICQEINEERTR
jgi:very-short-patch-repair endonuclease